MNDIEKAIGTLKKYHDLLHEVYADYAVYSKADNYSDKSLELASRANTVKNAVSTAITALEHQQSGGWIPVSERLPLDTGYYTITNKLGRLENLWFKATEKKWYFFHSDVEHLQVVAWRPLPQPYKEMSNEIKKT